MAGADPNAAAASLAGQTYAGAQERTAAGKQALLDQLSSQGTYSNALNSEKVAQAAPAQPASPGAAHSDPTVAALAIAGAQHIQQQNQATLQAAAALAAQQHAGLQQQAGTYFDQVNAAIPIEQSRAQSQASLIMADLIAKREAQAAALAAAKAAAANRGGGGNSMTPLERLSLGSKLIDAQDNALLAAMPRNFQYTDLDGNVVLNRRGQTVEDVANGMSLDDALKKNGLKEQSSRAEVINALNRYYGALQQSGYYDVTGTAPPKLSATPPQQAAGGSRFGSGFGAAGKAHSQAYAPATASPTAPAVVRPGGNRLEQQAADSWDDGRAQQRRTPASSSLEPIYGATGAIVGYVDPNTGLPPAGVVGNTRDGRRALNGRWVTSAPAM